MAFHILPLSQKHTEVVKQKLTSVCAQWINDWLPENKMANIVTVEMQQVNKSCLNTWLKLPNQDWFQKDESDQNNYIGIAYNQSFNENLVNQMTGCEYSDFFNGIVDIKKLLNQIREDLLKQIINSKLVSLNDNSVYLKELENVSVLLPNAAGWLVTITIAHQSILILLPNQLVKDLAFSERPQNLDKLVGRESAIGEYNLLLRIKIDGLNISLQDLNTLQIGDVLTTRQKSIEQIKVSIENAPLKNVSVVLGKRNEHKAIQFV